MTAVKRTFQAEDIVVLLAMMWTSAVHAIKVSYVGKFISVCVFLILLLIFLF